MIHLYPAGFHLALDSVGIVLLLSILLLVVIGVVLLLRRVNAAAVVGTFVAASLLAIVMTNRGTMAPDHAWPTILAAYQESTGAERLARAAELRNYWAYGEIREEDWRRLAQRWGVCHAMWYEPGCRRPPGPYEAQGIAREMLDGIARGP